MANNISNNPSSKLRYQPSIKIENQLQKEIVALCLEWLMKKKPKTTWEEFGKNKGEMLNMLKETFGFKKGAEAWCAMFGWGIIDQACKKVQGKNLMPKSAGAKALLDLSLKTNTVIVSDLPEIGAVMYRKSGDKKASGHIGIVVAIEDNGFYTIEGNVDDKVGMVYYPKNNSSFPIYEKFGFPIYFMWAGRFPHTGKARDTDTNLIIQQLKDTSGSDYLIGKPQSDLDLPEEKPIKKRKLKREFR
jgi:hypothetical protein